jgi:hypothetical protein
VGLERVDGELWAAGNSYKVHFEEKQVTFTPALPQAPRTHPVAIELTSFGRGAQRLPVSAAVLDHEGLVATYRRAEFEERYEVRTEGIEQSFVFEQLPAGSGDLCVRMRLQTDLTVHVTAPDELQLELPGVGGVRIGKVLGFDARGRRIDGMLRWDGGELELSLPSASVDQAVLPLVLDPIIGPILTVAGGPYSLSNPDVAYDATNSVFLVTFTVRVSASDLDIHAQFVDLDGNLVRSRNILTTANTGQTDSRVANVNGEDTFLVAYLEDLDRIHGVAVRAVDGWHSSVTLVDNANQMGTVDVGGVATATGNQAIVVWREWGAQQIRAKLIAVHRNAAPAGPGIVPAATAVLIGDLANTVDSFPAISKSGGDTGNHLIAYERTFPGVAGSAVQAVIVDRNLNILEDQIAITIPSNGRAAFPQVDGNGRNWIVAYEMLPPGVGEWDIEVAAIAWNPLAPVPDQSYPLATRVVLSGVPGRPERQPTVCWTGEAALVFYTVQGDVHGKQIDLYTCAQCPTAHEHTFSPNTTWDYQIRAASQASGGGSGGRVLAVWEQQPAGATVNQVAAIRYDADDGIVSDLGGGCGGGGHADLSCMSVGYSSFRMRLFGASPASPSLLLLGFTAINRPCGSCTLVPDPWSGSVGVAANTTALGNATFPLGIPANSALAGYGLYAQWVVGNTGSCIGFDLSNGLRAIIE